MNIGDFSQILKIAPYITIVAGIVIVIMEIRKTRNILRIVLSGAGTFILAFVLFYFSGTAGDQTDRLSSYIKNAHPSSISNITYGQVIDYCCKDVSWSYASKKDKAPYGYTVQADGKYKEEGSDITLQFFYNEDFEVTHIEEETPFRVSWIGKDENAEVTSDETEQTLFAMFQKYGKANGISVDESMMDGILQGVPAVNAGKTDSPVSIDEADEMPEEQSNSIETDDEIGRSHV